MRTSRKRNKEKQMMGNYTPSTVNEPVAEQSSATDSSKSDNNVSNYLDLFDKTEEVGKLARAILHLKPTLEVFSQIVQTDKDNILKERVVFENIIELSEMYITSILDAVKSASKDIFTINKHIDDLMEKAPTKLQITVHIADDEKKAFQSICDTKIKEMKSLHEKQLVEIRKEYQRWSNDAYNRENKLRHEISERLKSENGIYLTGFAFWLGLFFFFIGFGITIVSVFLAIYKCYR